MNEERGLSLVSLDRCSIPWAIEGVPLCFQLAVNGNALLHLLLENFLKLFKEKPRNVSVRKRLRKLLSSSRTMTPDNSPEQKIPRTLAQHKSIE